MSRPAALLRVANRSWWVVGLAALLAFVASLLGLSQLEEHDPFCTACHIAPEQTYFDRAQAATIESIDLSSDHYAVSERPFRCIDCHRGADGLADRAATLALGARDTVTYLTGRANQAIEKGSTTQPHLLNAACTRCHTAEVAVPGFNNHFHNELGTAGVTVSCSDCHRAHVPVAGGSDVVFLDIEGVVYPACANCHRQTGKGPLELNN